MKKQFPIMRPLLSAAAAATLWLTVTPSLPAAQAGEAPNILFIFIDDMGWVDPGCYGNDFAETPNIDRLADQGVRFTDFYAATPVCSSTRSTVQTGQYSARTRITDFIPGHHRPYAKLLPAKIEHHLDNDVKTVGTVLRDAGYATGYFGKWHLGWGAKQSPQARGYEITEDDIPKEQRVPNKNDPKDMRTITNAGMWFMEQHQDEPWFLTLSHHALHIPLEAYAPTIEKYRDKPNNTGHYHNPDYAAMLADLDREIGRLLAKLDQLGLRDNTVVVFTSDNGGLHKHYLKLGDQAMSNKPLRGQKGSLHEGGIRVPMIVRWPGETPTGVDCDEPTTTADLLPTFCNLAETELPDQPIDGLDMTSLFRNPSASLDREAIYFHYPHYHHTDPVGAIRFGDWKLIEHFEDGTVELYNLAKDLEESDNRADDRPQLARRLRQRLIGWREGIDARMPKPNPDYDPENADEFYRGNGKPFNLDQLRPRFERRRQNRAHPMPDAH